MHIYLHDADPTYSQSLAFKLKRYRPDWQFSYTRPDEVLVQDEPVDLVLTWKTAPPLPDPLAECPRLQLTERQVDSEPLGQAQTASTLAELNPYYLEFNRYADPRYLLEGLIRWQQNHPLPWSRADQMKAFYLTQPLCEWPHALTPANQPPPFYLCLTAQVYLPPDAPFDEKAFTLSQALERSRLNLAIPWDELTVESPPHWRGFRYTADLLEIRAAEWERLLEAFKRFLAAKPALYTPIVLCGGLPPRAFEPVFKACQSFAPYFEAPDPLPSGPDPAVAPGVRPLRMDALKDRPLELSVNRGQALWQLEFAQLKTADTIQTDLSAVEGPTPALNRMI